MDWSGTACCFPPALGSRSLWRGFQLERSQAQQSAGMFTSCRMFDMMPVAAKHVLAELWKGEGKTPLEIVKEKKLELIQDQKELEEICQAVIDGQENEVMAIKAGNRKVLNKLIGLVQRETQGRSNPVLVKQLLEKKLSE